MVKEITVKFLNKEKEFIIVSPSKTSNSDKQYQVFARNTLWGQRTQEGFISSLPQVDGTPLSCELLPHHTNWYGIAALNSYTSVVTYWSH